MIAAVLALHDTRKSIEIQALTLALAANARSKLLFYSLIDLEKKS